MTRKELREFRAKTTKLKTKKMDFETFKEILKEGILIFAKLRDQWAKLVQFFQMTSNIIDVCLKKSVKKLVDEVEVSAERSKSVPGKCFFTHSNSKFQKCHSKPDKMQKRRNFHIFHFLSVIE